MKKSFASVVQNPTHAPTLDIETASDGTILGIGCAWGPNFEDSEYWKIDEIGELPGTYQIVSHYGLYDVQTLLKAGYRFEVSFDTYSAARLLLWDRKEGFSLKVLAKEFLGVEDWGNPAELIKQYGSMEQVPYEIISAYCRKDALYTWKLSRIFYQMAKARNILPLVEYESKLNHILAHMRHVGFAFDTAHMQEIKAGLKAEREELYSQIQAILPGADLGSNDTLARQLFSESGLNINSKGMPMTPKTKRVSISAPIFEQYADRHHILPMIAATKHLDKLLSTYTDTYIHAAQFDGRIHSKLDSFGAGTGRLSSSDPAMQNIPAHVHGKLLRKAFIARPGFSLVSLDYKQIELVILAVMSKDEFMLDLFRNKKDMHRIAAEVLYGRPVTKEERNNAKPVNFGKIYGGGAWLFTPWAGNDWDAQRLYENKWYQLFPNVKAFHDSFWKPAMQQRGYNETFYGRRRKLHKLPQNASNQDRAGLMRYLINGDIQGTGGDVLKIGMVNSWEVVKQYPGLCYMVMCVHDEIIFEIANFKLKEIIQKLSAAMRDIPFPLQPEVDVEVGINWYEMEAWHD
jgi:DNA polymerase-1